MIDGAPGTLSYHRRQAFEAGAAHADSYGYDDERADRAFKDWEATLLPTASDGAAVTDPPSRCRTSTGPPSGD